MVWNLQHQTNDGIKKLSALNQTTPNTVVSKNSEPARFSSYIVTIINKDTEEEYKIYLPEYIAKHSLPGKRFMYNELQKKSDGSGHSYHA